MSIQKMRLTRGWSQQQLADASGLSARTIQRIEAGYPPSIESLKSIAAVFEVDFSILQSEPKMNDQTSNSQEARERIAFSRVRRLRDYYLHILSYIVVNLGCIAVNLLTTPDKIWFIGLVIFWGFGLLIHTIRIFVFDRFFGGEWEREQVEKNLGHPL